MRLSWVSKSCSGGEGMAESTVTLLNSRLSNILGLAEDPAIRLVRYRPVKPPRRLCASCGGGQLSFINRSVGGE
eukprot:4542406-Amphidinium_carterae.1